MATFKVAVSGTTYRAVLDPAVSSWTQEEGFPPPTVHRQGRGSSRVYELTDAQASELLDYLWNFDWWRGSDMPATRREWAAIQRDIKRIEAALADA